MSGSDNCIPRNETVRPHYFQNRIIMVCLPISTFMYLWAIYIFPQSVCLGSMWDNINRSKTHECGNWERGRAVSFLRKYVLNFWYSVISWLPKWSFLSFLHFALLMFMACLLLTLSPTLSLFPFLWILLVPHFLSLDFCGSHVLIRPPFTSWWPTFVQ